MFFNSYRTVISVRTLFNWDEKRDDIIIIIIILDKKDKLANANNYVPKNNIKNRKNILNQNDSFES